MTIRRTVGLKKDEWSIDKKAVTKSDVMNFLQAAGFSKSNPYYIVPQGRITALTNAKDSERLQLLKEVAGTRVYEEHRAESVKIMQETGKASGDVLSLDLKKQKIAELLEYIKERLQELEGEKEELSRFQILDRQRRTCEHLLYSREQLDITDALEQAEEEYKATLQDASMLDEKHQEDLDKLGKELVEVKHELN